VCECRVSVTCKRLGELIDDDTLWEVRTTGVLVSGWCRAPKWFSLLTCPRG